MKAKILQTLEYGDLDIVKENNNLTNDIIGEMIESAYTDDCYDVRKTYDGVLVAVLFEDKTV